VLPALERGEHGDAPARTHTVLVAEDETAVRNLVASSLRDEGYTLLLAKTAEEAIAIAEAHDGPIDLLLTDAVMPGKSGVELVKTLLARRPTLRVVFMSGYTDEDLNVAGIATPAPVLQKPFTPRDLRRRIRDALER